MTTACVHNEYPSSLGQPFHSTPKSTYSHLKSNIGLTNMDMISYM